MAGDLPGHLLLGIAKLMKSLLLAGLMLWTMVLGASAQSTSVQTVLQSNRDLIVASSRKTIAPAIDALADSGLPHAQSVLQTWQGKSMWLRKSDGLFFHGTRIDSKTYQLTDFDTGETVGAYPKADLKQIKPNSGIRAMIGTALVQFQLSDPDPNRRRDALTAITRKPSAVLLAPLRASIASETDADIKADKQRAERLLTIAHDPDTAARVTAITAMSGDLGVDLRATLNPLVAQSLQAFEGSIPKDRNIAERLLPGSAEFSYPAAYQFLVDQGLARPNVARDEIRAALTQHIEDGAVAGVPLHRLNTDDTRRHAYLHLAAEGLVPAPIALTQVHAKVDAHQFAYVFAEPDASVTTAAQEALADIEARVALSQTVDLTLDALSLASIYFLAAIGLAITFGVMGVINMAHGEFIMLGAYTGYVVQQIVPNHTVSILIAVPLAFAVTFGAGVAMERLVIRWLYNRPLETLLATFGISIALQQLAKNIFGTQARPLTAPGWLDGTWAINDVIAISYIRIAIFLLAIGFLGFFLFLMKRTRLGLETRAVTQNRRMAASMGINPDRVNMLTFGLGSGIAGIAGVAIGLFAKVTSELGSDYIVQSFMTVVVGGVGNIWGTLAGATMIGFLQKGIEWLNPSNTLAAQTFMIIFIIIFIQFRPRGIIALKGRAAGD